MEINVHSFPINCMISGRTIFWFQRKGTTSHGQSNQNNTRNSIVRQSYKDVRLGVDVQKARRKG